MWLAPLAIFVGGALAIRPVAAGRVLTWSVAWVPSLGVNASLLVDGLAVLMLTLIGLIGAAVFAYAPAYMQGKADRWRLYGWMSGFLAAMAGLVASRILW